MWWRRLIVGALLVAVGAPRLIAAPPADDPAKSVETSGREFITPETQAAIDRGLAFLAARQNLDEGFFGGEHKLSRNVAVNGLCGLAFLSGGNTPERGKYGKHVDRVLTYILSRARPNGYIIDEESALHGPMYGHGFATLFLAEVYGMTPRPEVRDKLELAIKLIVNTQNDEGGWRYQPQPKDADLSVTVCQIMALRAARNCGIYVPKETVDRCTEYVKRSQNADGGFRYQLNPSSQVTFGLTSAGVVALYSAGTYKGDEIDRGLAFLQQFRPGEVRRRPIIHYYYSHYYGVQAMWHAGGKQWRQWYPAVRDELVNGSFRLPGGGWTDPSNGDEYATAMACIILQSPNNFLPIFQR